MPEIPDEIFFFDWPKRGASGDFLDKKFNPVNRRQSKIHETSDLDPV
jgi:hypothetical protein